MARHPQNGPTLSKAPPKKQRPKPLVSSERRQAALDEKMRDAADTKLFCTDSRSWLKKHGVITGG